MSSRGSAVLQSGALASGLGLGAGVGGDAGAEGGKTFGLFGMAIGMVGTFEREEEGVCIRGRGTFVARALPCGKKLRLLCEFDDTRARSSPS